MTDPLNALSPFPPPNINRYHFPRSYPDIAHLRVAILKVAAAMEKMNLKWGLVGGCAILMFAELYDPPIVSRGGAAAQKPLSPASKEEEETRKWGPLLWRGSTRGIDIIIQPWEKVSVADVNNWLCNAKEFEDDFRAKPGFGPKRTQVVLKILSDPQPEPEHSPPGPSGFNISSTASKAKEKILNLGIGEKIDAKTGIKYRELFIDLNVYDHFVSYDRRADYDLRLRGNERMVQRFPNSAFPDQKIYLLNSAWLLKQKIKLWNSRDRKFDDWNDVKTLIEILKRLGKILVMKSEDDRADLLELIGRFRGDPRTVLREGIECPEVLGPWYRIGWVRILIGVVLGVVVLLVNEEWTSEY